eukprot:SAG31_NODE_1525_length_8006_cov_5.106614_1_plen_128_part_00
MHGDAGHAASAPQMSADQRCNCIHAVVAVLDLPHARAARRAPRILVRLARPPVFSIFRVFYILYMIYYINNLFIWYIFFGRYNVRALPPERALHDAVELRHEGGQRAERRPRQAAVAVGSHNPARTL